LKAIKKLYNFKGQSAPNQFANNNQENRVNQMNNPFENSSNASSNQFGEVRRRRKFNDMCCDSPTSSKTNQLESDEEDKHNVSMQSTQSQQQNQQ
jgi:hypothetical protein